MEPTEEDEQIILDKMPSMMFSMGMDLDECADQTNNRILIVDDEPFNLLGLETVLKLAMEKTGLPDGYLSSVLDKAANGEEAVEAVNKLYYQ